MENKKVALVVVLVIIIVAAFVLVGRHLGILGGPQPSSAVLNAPLALIDMDAPYTLMTKTQAEWDKLGKDDAGRYKDPDTGKYTMVKDWMYCPHCHKPIPRPQIPDSLKDMRGKDAMMAMGKIRMEYKCPLCGKLVFGREPGEVLPPPRIPQRK